jgi:hypothetical protein
MNLQVADLGSAPIASLGGYVPAAKDNGGVDQLIQAFLGGALGSMGSELGQNIMANDVSAEAAKQGLGPGEQGAFKRWFSPYTKGDLKADRADSMDKQRMRLEGQDREDTRNYRTASLAQGDRQLAETVKDREARLALERSKQESDSARWLREFEAERRDKVGNIVNTDARFTAEDATRNRALSLQEKELNLKTSIESGYKLEDLDMTTGLPKVKPAVPVAAPTTNTNPVDELNNLKNRPQSRLALEVAATPSAFMDWVNPPGTPTSFNELQNPVRGVATLLGTGAGKVAEGYDYMMSPPPEQLRGAKYKSPEQLLAEFANLSQNLTPAQAAEIEARLRAQLAP